MYILSSPWFETLIRKFFFDLDKVVFGLISIMYDLIILIARTSPLTQGDITKMAERIYQLLAIFMIFKVTFSLIMYIVNPDDFTEKNKGVSKLLANVIISLSLLILTPFMFKYAYTVQKIVLEDNSMAALVFGEEVEKGYFNTAGEDMTFITFSPFFVPNTSLPALAPCNTFWVKENIKVNDKTVVKTVVNSECSGINNSDYSTASGGMFSLVGSGATLTETDIKNYVVGMNNRVVGLAFRKDLAIATDDSENFVMDYSFLASTAVGIVVVLLLLSYCMDIAVRSIKLAFLQLIAPVPIISYIDPKSGKDGMFKKWYKMCLSTYVSLFLRLLILYFMVYIVKMITDHGLVDIYDGSYTTNAWVWVFILIGALMFAKQFPKILENLGVKLDGGGKFTLNPLKKVENEALGVKKLLGLGATAGAAGLAGAVNVASRLPSSAKQLASLRKKDAWKDANGKVNFNSIKKGVGKGLGALAQPVTSGIGGFASAAQRGISKTAKGEKAGKIFSDSYGEAMFAKKQREDLTRKVGATTMGDKARFAFKSALADVERWAGISNAGQRQEIELAKLDAEYQNRRSEQKRNKELLEKAHLESQNRKREVIRNSQAKQENFSAIAKNVATLKNSVVNVKDREENVKQMQERGEWYAKVGDVINKKVKKGDKYEQKLQIGDVYRDDNGLFQKVTAEDVANGKTKVVEATADGFVTTVANQNDVDNLALTAAGQAADEDLKRARREGLKYLTEHDGETQQLLNESYEILMNDDYGLRNMMIEDGKNNNEINDLLTDKAKRGKYIRELFADPSKIKTLYAKAESEVKDINKFYKSEEKQYEDAVNNIDLELKLIEEHYQKDIKDKGLDKTSREWIENEAANAARRIKTKEPEGFKSSPVIDENDYTPFNTALKQGNAAVPPTGGNQHGHPDRGPRGH